MIHSAQTEHWSGAGRNTRLTSLGGGLSIHDNNALMTLDGLSSLTSVGGDLQVYDNPPLCQSLVDAFVVTCSCGTVVDISGNDGGC